MRRLFIVMTLFLGALAMQAQEKVMNILMTDGTSTQTRVAELTQISFLTVDEGGQGLLVKTVSGETVAVLFETNPVVTVANGKLVVTPASAEAMEFEITDIAEIIFCNDSDPMGIDAVKNFDYVLQDGGVLLRGIPESTKPYVYSIDGRCLPTPLMHNGELFLSRETLGTGIFIIKVGSFATKVHF